MFAKDTLNGFTDFGVLRSIITNDGLLWMTGFQGSIYTITYGRTIIPHVTNKTSVNSFYLEPDGKTLWFGTDDGLAQKDLTTQKVKLWSHDPKNNNSLNNNAVVGIRADEQGKLWLATHQGGLDQFDPKTEKFTHYKHDTADKASIGMVGLHCLFFEDAKTLWIGAEEGLSRMDLTTERFTNFLHDNKDSNSILTGSVYCIVKDKNNAIWVGTSSGLERYDRKLNNFHHYLKDHHIKTICIDRIGMLWAGGELGLFSYNPENDKFKRFTSDNFPNGIEGILNILEDNDGNFWITTINAVLKMNVARTEIKLYNASYGVESSSFLWLDNYKAPDGRLFIGNGKGYFAFYPKEVNDDRVPPLMNFTNFRIGDKEVRVAPNSVLTSPIWKTEKITLAYDQNTFSVEFNVVDYSTKGEIKYFFLLENYEKNWHDIGSDHRASFYNIPHGTYVLKVKAINSEGLLVQKSLILVINPPWWKTWWAYSIYALLLILAGWGIYKYQRQHILRIERKRTQDRELAQAREIEKAYTELKATQTQLIQSEKMASLGELTAGIAHEIQNPLNFVNNFSEVNIELLDELKDGPLRKLPEDAKKEADEIVEDLSQNLDKISFHGKRADCIVKGMLQHRQTSGNKRVN